MSFSNESRRGPSALVNVANGTPLVDTLSVPEPVTLTTVGATFPYGKDPDDSNLRIAPSFPPVDELKTAAEVLCTCAKLAYLEKELS